MANLLPEGYDSEVITDDEIADEQPKGYLNGIAFDISTGDLTATE